MRRFFCIASGRLLHSTRDRSQEAERSAETKNPDHVTDNDGPSGDDHPTPRRRRADAATAIWTASGKAIGGIPASAVGPAVETLPPAAAVVSFLSDSPRFSYKFVSG